MYFFFFHVARYEINPWHTALRVLAPLSASTWGTIKKHHRKLVFFEVLGRRVIVGVTIIGVMVQVDRWIENFFFFRGCCFIIR